MSDHKTKLQEEPRVVGWEGSETLPSIPDKNFAVFMLEEMGKVVEKSHNAVAVIDAETGKRRTYTELCHLVPRVSAGLAKAGIGLGDKVFYCSPNHIDYALVFLSVLHRGATVFMVSPITDTLQDLVLKNVGTGDACYVIINAELLHTAEAVFSQLPTNVIKKVWVIGDVVDKPNIEDLFVHDAIPPVTQAHGLDLSNAVAHIRYSSGTTGPRKGMMISHRNEVSRFIIFKAMAGKKEWPNFSLHSTCLFLSSVSHLYGHIFLFNSLINGGTNVIIPNFSLTSTLEAINAHQVTLGIFTPAHLKMLVNAPLVNQHSLDSLNAVTCSAMPLSESLAKSFMEKVNASIYVMYGMSEITSTATSCVVDEDWKTSCIGKVLPMIEVKVMDINDGKMLGTNEHGELYIRSPTSTIGYLNNPTETSNIIDAEGWIRTGDYGYYDCEGSIYLLDRIKDLLKVQMGLQLGTQHLYGIFYT